MAPPQRPFLSNFLAAFRAHSQQLPTKASTSLTTAGAVTSTATIWTSASSTPTSELTAVTTSPRPINPKGNTYTSTTPAQDRQFHTHSLPPLQHNVSPQTHLPRSPPSPGGAAVLPVYGPPNKPQPSYPTCQEVRRGSRTRRGSDSSSDSGGFRDVNRGGSGGPQERWFVGGRTAGGEEKYYKLSMVKRDRSSDRISADQLSL